MSKKNKLRSPTRLGENGVYCASAFVHRSLMDVEGYLYGAGRLCNLRSTRNSNPDSGATGQALSMSAPKGCYITCFKLTVPLMFSPVHPPPTRARVTKFINMSSRGVHVVASDPVVVGRPLGVTPRLPKRSAGARRTEPVFESRLTRTLKTKTFRAENGKSTSSCAVRNVVRMQSRRSGAYKQGKKEPW